MMEEKKSALLHFVTDYLSLGYLYLILLGVVSDSIYYGLIGVNIMNYASALDILLSPVARLTSNVLFPVTILLITILGYFFFKFLKKKQQKSASAHLNRNYLESTSLFDLTLFFAAFAIFSYYIGVGLGGGLALRKKLVDHQLTANHKIILIDNETVEVKWIGSNSGFVFYVVEGEDVVSISPVPNVKRMHRLSGKNKLKRSDAP